MGKIRTLSCPFCCNETFDDVESLKKHISDVSNNVKCSLCSENFSDLSTLLIHLDECEKSLDNSDEEISIQDLDISTKEAENGEENSEKTEDEEKEFYCEMCNIYFKGMKKHLMECHLGQEVVVESQYLESMLDEGQTIQTGEIDQSEIPPDTTAATEQIFLEQEILNETGGFYTKKLTKLNIVQSLPVKTTPIVEHMIFLDGGATIIEKEPNINVENAIKVYRCQNCNLRFTQRVNFTKHVCDSKTGEVCNVCSIHFTTKGALTFHKRKLHGEQKQPKEIQRTECDVCRIVFQSMKAMHLHKKMHEPITKQRKIEDPVTYNIVGKKICDKNNETFTCNVCGKEYNRKYEEVHMKSHNEEEFNCAICNRQFTDKTHLALHTQAHGNEIAKKLSCGFCKKLFSNETTLKDHMDNDCHGTKKYACSFCGRRFLRPHEKVKHERIHTGQKPHVCEVCGKAFRVSYCLSLHMRTHSGIRPYHCETCGKRFKSHGSYAHHVQTHSDVRPYKCPFCEKSFKTTVQLSGHKNTHTKPFSCNVCNRPFATLYAVRIHSKSHDRQNNLTFKCHICGAIYARKFALRDHLLTHSKNDVAEKKSDDEVEVDADVDFKCAVEDIKVIEIEDDGFSMEELS